MKADHMFVLVQHNSVFVSGMRLYAALDGTEQHSVYGTR